MRLFLRNRVLFSFLGLLFVAVSANAAEIWWPGDDYPPAEKDSTPEWLTSKKICFSRWDGGRIEATKGFLSGWDFFNPPWPDVIHATTNWYEPETVQLAVEMGYDFIWVTFSNGFSIELESGHWEQLREYVAECHKHNIKVAAYMSACNLFVDDMLERVPEAKEWFLIGADGKPVPYGAANYKKIGRTTRMLADITHPGWKAYLKRRIDVALDLGFDALEYDNIFYVVGGSERSKNLFNRFLEKNGFADGKETRRMYGYEQRRRFFRELLAYARERKPDIILYHNDNYPHYSAARSDTILSTEDGKEPGYYSIDSYAHEIEGGDPTPPLYTDLLDVDLDEPFDPDRLATNLGALRLLKGLDQGWKPVLVEFGGRRNAHRMLNQMPPLSFQLSVAECNAALCSYQGYQEGRALLDLYERKQEIVPLIEAAGEAHRFVKQHQKHVVGAEFHSDVAVVLDDRLAGRDFLKRLARENVQYEVLFEDRVQREFLNRFQRVLVYDAQMISEKAIEELLAYSGAGGRMMVFAESGKMDTWGQPRESNPLLEGQGWEKRDSDADSEELVRFLTEGVSRSFEVTDCPYVLFTLTEHSDYGEGVFAAHLLNYTKQPLRNVRLRCSQDANLSLLSLTPNCNEVVRGEGGEWTVPTLGLYSIVLAELQESLREDL